MKKLFVMEERILYDVYVDAHSIAVFPSIEAAKAFMQEHYPDWEPRPFDGAEGCNMVLLWENKKNRNCGREFALGEVPADPAEARWPKA